LIESGAAVGHFLLKSIEYRLLDDAGREGLPSNAIIC
jgi:hypothetical protein